MNSMPGVSERVKDDVDLLDYVVLMWRYRFLFIAVSVLIVGATVGITIMTPKHYEGVAAILAPPETGASSVLGALAVSGVAQHVSGIQVPSATPNQDMLLGVLKSRSIKQATVERFRLRDRYKKDDDEDAVKVLESMTTIGISRDGVISVAVQDIDRNTAADIANFYVDQLDEIITKLGSGSAGRQRRFLSVEFARTQADLKAAENALKGFQERHQAVVLEDQTRQAVEGAARLRGEIVASEIQLQVMRKYATETNSDVVRLRGKITEMKRQLTQMQYGNGAPSGRGIVSTNTDRTDMYVPFAQVPGVGLELARLTRDVKVHETLVMILGQTLEQTRIAEAKDVPTVQILDRAVPKKHHVKPRLLNNVILAAALSLFMGVVTAFSVEHIREFRRRRTRQLSDVNLSIPPVSDPKERV
jgi:tyrosine-protein kinase Etk/Wzc